MAIQLYQPVAGATLQNPVYFSWEKNGGKNGDVYVWHSNSWHELNGIQCASGVCSHTIDIGYEYDGDVEIYMNGEYTGEVSIQTYAEGASSGDITVTVDTEELEAKLEEVRLINEDIQLYADALTGILLATAFFVSAFFGYQSGVTR